MAKKLKAEVVVLDDEAQSKFDKFLKANKVASKGRRATDESRALRDEIVELMGEAMLAQLPDGRRIQRVPQCRHYPPKRAAVIEWDELNEIPAEE